jgi:oxygen-dependent protoporphyrinogen oxidase
MTDPARRAEVSDRTQQTAVVIGAGVSGLAVTYELEQRIGRLPGEVRLICLEARDRAGGNVRSERHSEFLCEWGPNGFLDNAPATLALARRLGLEGRLVRAEQVASRRYLYRRGRLRLVPGGPLSFLGSDILPLGGKLRLLAEPLVRGKRDGADESVFDFAARRIGSAAASVMVDAMVSGIYAGDARQLSLPAAFPRMREVERDHGSLFRAMVSRMRRARRGERQAGGPAGPAGTLTSFRDGMQELTDTLARAAGPSLELNRPVSGVSHMGRRGLRVHMAEGPPLEADAVVLANPAPETTRMVAAMDPEMAGAIAAIPSAPLVVLHFGFQTAALGEQPVGFGFLVPRGEGLRMLGSLWASHIFKERAPAERRLITVMIGGAHDPAAAELDDDELVGIVRKELEQAMQIHTPPYFVRLIRHPQGIPQYTLGHLDRVATVERRLEQYPGLFVSGNSYRGISINACVEEAPAVADAVTRFLAPRMQLAAR